MSVSRLISEPMLNIGESKAQGIRESFFAATRDHADIRGFAIAIRLSVAKSPHSDMERSVNRKVKISARDS
jgi:hypothetical protein